MTGVFDPATQTMRAERIVLLTDLEREAEGTAVIEEERDTPEGIVLIADGRPLLITEGTQLTRPKREELESLDRLEELQTGLFVQYRGLWTEAGLVEVKELSAWTNSLDEREGSLYEKYQPVMLVPPEAEAGPVVLKVDKNRYTVLDDPELQLYVDRLGKQLLPNDSAGRLGHNFWFLVVVHERPQASAFPGGVVVIHTGLFELVDNEAQLAFAIAHEIAHVTQEHAWREYLYHRKKLLVLRWATAGLGYIVESAIQRGYQRDLEEQADRLALWYMARAGYDPREGIRFLRRLQENQQGLSALLWQTHRSYGSRVEAVMNELVRYSVQGLPYELLTRDSPEFAVLRERIPRAQIDAAVEQIVEQEQ
ncbi:M48 family metallopeptidase [Acidobacteriia bacterium AH_259_A11_L15]|nr:M48 family metallopeptidase [Acidobacteriia bacterium AH_259_A11_L15]